MNLQALVNRVETAATEYYLGEPTITDYEFDKLVNQIRSQDPAHPILSKVGWGLKLYGETVPLPIKIQSSLLKMHDADTILNMDDTVNYSCAPKLDGMTAVLQYDNDGRLMLACTRGDGENGIDITPKMPYLRNDVLRGPGATVIRGELVIRKSVFNENLGNIYANPRNGVSGIINKKSFDRLEFVEFVCHNDLFYDHVECVETTSVHRSNLTDEFLQSMYAAYDSQDFLVDGVVVHCESKWIAWKGETETVDGTVKTVHWSLSDTGRLNPCVELEERMTLYGTSVGQSISCHHAKYVMEKGIGPGARVRLTKANEIIPYIVEVLSPSDNVNIPTEYNGQPTEWEGVGLMCKNPEIIQERRMNRYLNNYFTTDKAKDFVSLRVGLNIKTHADIAALIGKPDMVRAKMIAHPNIGGGKADLFASMWPDDKTFDSGMFLISMAIRNLGMTLSQRAGKLLPHIDDGCEEFIKIIKAPGHAAKNMREDWELIVEAYALFRDRLVIPAAAEKPEVVAYAVLTGAMTAVRSAIVLAGAGAGVEIQGGVGRHTNYVVAADPNGGSSKLKAARMSGIPIISEAEFKEMFKLQY